MLLVGIGGSGRQSLAKLASYTLEYKVFMIEVTKHYRRQEFHEGMNLDVMTTNFLFNCLRYRLLRYMHYYFTNIYVLD